MKTNEGEGGSHAWQSEAEADHTTAQKQNTLLFLMRPLPHDVLDTSAESIPNFETKNKVLTHFMVLLTPLFHATRQPAKQSLDIRHGRKTGD